MRREAKWGEGGEVGVRSAFGFLMVFWRVFWFFGEFSVFLEGFLFFWRVFPKFRFM